MPRNSNLFCFCHVCHGSSMPMHSPAIQCQLRVRLLLSNCRIYRSYKYVYGLYLVCVNRLRAAVLRMLAKYCDKVLLWCSYVYDLVNCIASWFVGSWSIIELQSSQNRWCQNFAVLETLKASEDISQKLQLCWITDIYFLAVKYTVYMQQRWYKFNLHAFLSCFIYCWLCVSKQFSAILSRCIYLCMYDLLVWLNVGHNRPKVAYTTTCRSHRA